MRRPSISTSVREEPRLRRLTVAVPEAPFDTVEFWAANACGNCVIRSSTRVTPATSMSSPVTWVTGLVVSRLICGMREPVTTIASTSVTGSWARTEVAAKALATPAIIVDVKRRCRLKSFIFVLHFTGIRIGPDDV